MDKFWLVVNREYLTRVRKKSFIISTLLTPVAFALFFVVVFFILRYDGDKEMNIVIVDEAGILADQNIASSKDGSIHYTKSTKPFEELKKEVSEEKYSGILKIPALANLKSTSHTIYYYSEKSPGIELQERIKSAIKKVVRNYKITELNLNKEDLKILDTSITFDPEPIKEGEKDTSSFASAVGAFMGIGMGMIMYMVVLIYGMMVMRSVMEEKMNRIVEVIVSSIDSFKLMLGKIVGVGAVGLTQMIIWFILIPLLYFGAAMVFGINPDDIDQGNLEASGLDPEDMESMIMMGMEELRRQNWFQIVPLFLFYFLGGYFLYASLFAAIGSAIGDDLGESQTLSLPITLIIAIAIYIMLAVVRSPESSLAVWSSIFPLFSPIVMPARLAFDPPMWQVAVSMLALIATVLFFTWLSGRIFRIGILLYGKKIGFKEMGKWIFTRN